MAKKMTEKEWIVLAYKEKRKQRRRDMWERHEKFAEYVERVRKKRRAGND